MTPVEGLNAYTCALCGFGFAAPAEACSGCAVAGAVCPTGSTLAACPRCGHQFPRESVIINFARRALGWLRERRKLRHAA